jgi:aryl-alcohol dehydrogenase-like predicted oxidoreductase
MKKTPLRNFHVPLSEELYNQLRAEAERSRQSAIALARYAMAWWLQQQQKAVLDENIRAYAAQGAGTPADLDQELEAASVDHLLDEEKGI